MLKMTSGHLTLLEVRGQVGTCDESFNSCLGHRGMFTWYGPFRMSSTLNFEFRYRRRFMVINSKVIITACLIHNEGRSGHREHKQEDNTHRHDIHPLCRSLVSTQAGEACHTPALSSWEDHAFYSSSRRNQAITTHASVTRSHMPCRQSV